MDGGTWVYASGGVLGAKKKAERPSGAAPRDCQLFDGQNRVHTARYFRL